MMTNSVLLKKKFNLFQMKLKEKDSVNHNKSIEEDLKKELDDQSEYFYLKF